ADCEYRIRHTDGTVRWVADRKRRIVEADGVVKLVGGIIEDISARKAVAQALRRANERLEARVEARTAELQVVNQELDAFTRTAAHDLKTPLNAIIGFTDLLRRRHGAALGPEG
ncbi:histidine kinase dimerization/phospho-acceptor domain-containing protein, partial [Salmonella enterica]|uniref:histidine kinase dimerization/phospho-acceptor domain-containing protein n=1 Tax=Salmonella enterica TaxID=28901 RepID=UPI003FD73D88